MLRLKFEFGGDFRGCSGMAEKGKTWKTDYSPLGILGTREGVLEVSSIPSMGLENRLKYLFFTIIYKVCVFKVYCR